MKMPDEIKKGLECCKNYQSCTEYGEPKCPYNDIRECVDTLLDDALAYIRQIEAERDNYRDELTTELGCNTCKHFDNDAGAVSGYCEYCNMWSDWEWRGVQKEG